MANCHFRGFLLPFLIKIFIVHIRLARSKQSRAPKLLGTQGEPLPAVAWILNQASSLGKELAHTGSPESDAGQFFPSEAGRKGVCLSP